jgi:hypothetical protein
MQLANCPVKNFNTSCKNLISNLGLLLLLLTGCGKNLTDNASPSSGATYLLDKSRVYYITDSTTDTGSQLFYKYAFDNEGQVVEKLETDSNGNCSIKYTYSYYNNSLLKEATVQRVKYSPKIYSYKFIYSNSHLVNVEIRYDGAPNYVSYVYTYEGDDTATWAIKQTILDSILNPRQAIGENHVYYRLSGQRRLDMVSGRATLYTYNGENKLLSRTFFNSDTLSGIAYTLEYTYDNNGCVSEEKYKLGSDYERITRYTYKNYGNVKNAPIFFMVLF